MLWIKGFALQRFAVSESKLKVLAASFSEVSSLA